MRSPNFKFVRPRGLLISIFLFSILVSYNNCTKTSFIDLDNFVEVELLSDNIQEVLLSEEDIKLRFKVVKLDSKVYSLSKFSIYPFSHKHEKIVITQGKKTLNIRINEGSLEPSSTHLFRTEENNKLVKIGLR